MTNRSPQEHGTSIVVTGSIAYDHLMVFPGRFTEQLVEDRLERVSLSFLVDDLRIHRGGVGANVAFGLGVLGLRPMLLGAVGHDFGDFREWLEQHQVVTRHVHVSERQHTARFWCTTDLSHNQIASFYPGAMNEARDIDLTAILRRAGDVDLVMIGPDDPEAMVRHTSACRRRGVRFAADPSQQLARMDGRSIRQLVEGAHYLFTNEYERELLERKSGWSRHDVLSRVGTWITTLGPNGVSLESRYGDPTVVKAARTPREVDPTGVGDAFRSGFLAGIAWQLEPERAAQLGCMMATLVLETAGTQEYEFDRDVFLTRLAESYGLAAAGEIRRHWPAIVLDHASTPVTTQ